MATAPTTAPVGRAAAAVGIIRVVGPVDVGMEPVPVGYVPLDEPLAVAEAVVWQAMAVPSSI